MQPTEMQTLILWALLAKGGKAYAKDIKPEVKKKDREALLGLGLVGASVSKRAFVLEVTDKGWAWAADHLNSPLPVRSTAGTQILQAWLAALGAHLRANGTPLSEVLAPPPKPIEQSVGDSTGLRARIREAYLDITAGSFNRRALLRDLRDKLKDIDRETLDAALLRMQVEDNAALMPLDNRLEITDADREAAIHIGAEQRHILWIER
jgi:hypothetical protein